MHRVGLLGRQGSRPGANHHARQGHVHGHLVQGNFCFNFSLVISVSLLWFSTVPNGRVNSCLFIPLCSRRHQIFLCRMSFMQYETQHSSHRTIPSLCRSRTTVGKRATENSVHSQGVKLSFAVPFSTWSQEAIVTPTWHHKHFFSCALLRAFENIVSCFNKDGVLHWFVWKPKVPIRRTAKMNLTDQLCICSFSKPQQYKIAKYSEDILGDYLLTKPLDNVPVSNSYKCPQYGLPLYRADIYLMKSDEFRPPLWNTANVPLDACPLSMMKCALCTCCLRFY